MIARFFRRKKEPRMLVMALVVVRGDSGNGGDDALWYEKQKNLESFFLPFYHLLSYFSVWLCKKHFSTSCYFLQNQGTVFLSQADIDLPSEITDFPETTFFVISPLLEKNVSLNASLSFLLGAFLFVMFPPSIPSKVHFLCNIIKK